MEKSERKGKKKRKHKTEELQPMSSYVSDRPALLSQLFLALPKDKMLAMLPPVLRDVPQDELRADCLEMLLGLSARRICSILRGEQLGSSSSSETDSQSEISQEPSPSRQSIATSAPEQTNENCSLLEIVELQLRARAIRAALSHGEADNGNERPPTPKKCVTSPVVTSENPPTGSEIEAECPLVSAVEPEVARAKKRPVLVGPLKRLGKRVLLTVNSGSSTTPPLAVTATSENKPVPNGEILAIGISEKAGEANVTEDQVYSGSEEWGKVASPAGANALETIKKEPTNVECVTSTLLKSVSVGPKPAILDQSIPDQPGTEMQVRKSTLGTRNTLGSGKMLTEDGTWVDRRLQQAASPTLRSSLIGTTRQRLANNDITANPAALPSGNQPEVVHSPAADEGSVTQYDSLASNALDIEPLVLNYEED